LDQVQTFREEVINAMAEIRVEYSNPEEKA
jgi:hypothetical protein